MEEDDGKDFFMVNFLDYNESPETMPATGKGASSSNLMNYYMEYMYPEMFKRASHPVFFSEVFFPAMDIVSAEGMEDWDNVAFVRYRSRKDMLEIGLNPIFDERHLYKIEALEKTIDNSYTSRDASLKRFKTNPFFSITDFRFSN